MNPTHFLPFFDPTRPVFVKQDNVQLSGKIRKKGELFDWQKFGISYPMMVSLFNQDFLHHNPELEEEKSDEIVNKNVEDMNIAELHIYIDRLNAKFKEKVKPNEYNKKKCPKVPKDTELQVRKINFWRGSYGHLLD